uniref:Uncharacterized protein n=1 Tax=Pseudonaja textilis TaxID=8673 RepID=A0A670YCK5_PSETE
MALAFQSDVIYMIYIYTIESLRKGYQRRDKMKPLKEKGNDAFAQGDYALAVQNYTEGLKKQKDMPALYTNRAQAYIKLQKYEKAIDDCSWALRCDEKCTKALFHMGKAYLAKKQFQQVRPRWAQSLCRAKLWQVVLGLQPEEAASEDLKTGKLTAVAVSEMLQKLSKPDQDPLYYAGGLQLLTDLVQACECPIDEAAPD